MDQARARALITGERVRLQRLLQADTDTAEAAELGDAVDDVDRRSAQQTGMVVDQLQGARWAALQRAEARLTAGSYGRLVGSGKPTPTTDWRPTRPEHSRRRGKPAGGQAGARAGSKAGICVARLMCSPGT